MINIISGRAYSCSVLIVPDQEHLDWRIKTAKGLNWLVVIVGCDRNRREPIVCLCMCVYLLAVVTIVVLDFLNRVGDGEERHPPVRSTWLVGRGRSQWKCYRWAIVFIYTGCRNLITFITNLGSLYLNTCTCMVSLITVYYKFRCTWSAEQANFKESQKLCI